MTTEDVKKLSDDELRVKVAYLCGWTGISSGGDWTSDPVGMPPRGNELNVSETIPDYPVDLNAMHEAEKMLDQRIIEYYGELAKMKAICYLPTDPLVPAKCLRATARQRAEAFVLTLQQ